MNLSPRYSEEQWKAAFDLLEDWDRAITIVEDRIRGRWFDAADRLLEAPHSGFAIIVLDCIVLESLWGFRNGKSVPRHGERQIYRDVLTGPCFGWSVTLADDFREFVRNGLMHDAETRRGWLVEKTVPHSVVPKKKKDGHYVLNRTMFHQALSQTFEDWISELRSGDLTLRKNMRDRMNQIIAKHYGA